MPSSFPWDKSTSPWKSFHLTAQPSDLMENISMQKKCHACLQWNSTSYQQERPISCTSSALPTSELSVLFGTGKFCSTKDTMSTVFDETNWLLLQDIKNPQDQNRTGSQDYKGFLGSSMSWNNHKPITKCLRNIQLCQELSKMEHIAKTKTAE